MLKKTFSGLAIILAFACCTLAQSAYTPEKDSPERKAILDALRVPVEKKLNQKVVFSITDLKVQGAWAFLGGAPQSAGGGRPNYKGTVYQSAIDNGFFDNNIFAVLKKTAGKWKVVKYQIGCTDVCYAIWWKDYKAPKAIFPVNY